MDKNTIITSVSSLFIGVIIAEKLYNKPVVFLRKIKWFILQKYIKKFIKRYKYCTFQDIQLFLWSRFYVNCYTETEKARLQLFLELIEIDYILGKEKEELKKTESGKYYY